MARAVASTPVGAGSGPEPGSGWRSPVLRTLRPVIVLFTVVLVGATLYFARAVLMPIALAGLLTFLLGPVADFLHRRRVPRAVAVLLVVVLAFTVIGAVGYVLLVQATSLADELPRYQLNIREKIADIRGAGTGGSLEKVKETVKDVAGAMEEKPVATPPPQRVVVDQPPGAALWNFPALVGPWVEPLATAGLVIVLVIFMLLERQQLRNRIIRLVGYGRLTDTTKALDEAGQRISRYLLMQSLVNAFFGVCIGVGLWLIGVPYAPLWGFLAGVLRFIPYAGPWIAALLPVALSLAAFPGWQKPLLVIALFLVLELFTNMVLETLLYAGSAGVSEVALLIAVAFWTWLWGAVGLMLATPLTVCLVVFAKHVPAMRFLTVLMADDPPLPPEVHYYQRLLAGDQDEAAGLVEDHFKAHPRDAIYDDLLIPALNYLKRDREGLTEADEAFIARATHEIVEDVETMQAIVDAAEPADGPEPLARVRIVGCAARDWADALALSMLRHVLDPERFDLEIVKAGTLSAEVVELVGRRQPVAVCVAALPPGGFAQARYLCKRLRARFPELRILVGRWGGSRFQDEHLDALSAAGADDVGRTLLGTRDALLALAPLAPPRSAETEAGSLVRDSAA